MNNKAVSVDVSFVIPTKNEEANITRCIESLLACDQKKHAIEILVVDNGSDDQTVELAKKLSVTVLEHPGLSISALRNVGANGSAGTYIAFIDADVTIENDWLHHAIAEIEKTNVGAVGSSPQIPPNSNWVVQTWHLQIGTRPELGERDWLASMNMLVRREVFTQVGGFDETLTTCEDVDLGYRISQHHRIIYAKNIRAVHYGEAQSLAELFKKEAWRGSYNYRGLIRHGWRFGEIPSIVQPIITLLSLSFIGISIFSGSLIFLLVGTLFFIAFPAAKTVQIILRTGSWRSSIRLMLVWSTYSLARSWSALIEIKHLLSQRRSLEVTQ